MKNNVKVQDDTQSLQSCVSSSVTSDGWIEATYNNLPNENCKVYVCIEGVPQVKSREFSINGGNKYIKCGRTTKKITHFKVKL